MLRKLPWDKSIKNTFFTFDAAVAAAAAAREGEEARAASAPDGACEPLIKSIRRNTVPICVEIAAS